MKKYDILIIGSGPAGMSAATYAVRGNLKVAMMDRSAPGGKMVKTAVVDNFIGFPMVTGPDLSFKMYEHTQNLGVEYLYGDVVDLKKTTDNWFYVDAKENSVLAKCVVVATGTIERKIGIPNESEYYGRGVSYCAVCDAALYKDRPVVVIGGGNAAAEESVYLTKFCSVVYLVHRRYEFRATKVAVEDLYSNKKIKMFLNYVATEVLVDGSQVTGLKIKEKEKGAIEQLKVDCVFPFIGQDPVSKFLSQWNILNDTNFVLVNDKMQTSVSGLIACGDVIHKNLRQIANAVGEGAIAGQNAVYYVDMFNKENLMDIDTVDKLNLINKPAAKILKPIS